MIKANTTDVKTLGDTKAKGISDAAAAFGAGMLKIGDGIDAAMADYTKPTKASLAQHKADCLAELRTLKKTTETELNGRKTTYAADLKKQVAGLCPRIRDEVFNAAREKEKGLETRAKNAYSAMRGMGTDEDKLFDALRGMEKGQPGALRVVFKNIAGSSIDSWLVDDLDEDELKIARAHLSLNHGAAARLEIADNINWYGDDEAQVEKILRPSSGSCAR